MVTGKVVWTPRITELNIFNNLQVKSIHSDIKKKTS
jgi:hypothetical protein